MIEMPNLKKKDTNIIEAIYTINSFTFLEIFRTQTKQKIIIILNLKLNL
jgi:hypothetical protein